VASNVRSSQNHFICHILIVHTIYDFLAYRSFHCQILPALLRVPSCAQVTLKNFLNKHSLRAIILASVCEFIIPMHVKANQAELLIMNFSRW
jgi:hypothetical protein